MSDGALWLRLGRALYSGGGRGGTTINAIWTRGRRSGLLMSTWPFAIWYSPTSKTDTCSITMPGFSLLFVVSSTRFVSSRMIVSSLARQKAWSSAQFGASMATDSLRLTRILAGSIALGRSVQYRFDIGAVRIGVEGRSRGLLDAGGGVRNPGDVGLRTERQMGSRGMVRVTIGVVGREAVGSGVRGGLARMLSRSSTTCFLFRFWEWAERK